jgi:hypothetical protein
MPLKLRLTSSTPSSAQDRSDANFATSSSESAIIAFAASTSFFIVFANDFGSFIVARATAEPIDPPQADPGDYLAGIDGEFHAAADEFDVVLVNADVGECAQALLAWVADPTGGTVDPDDPAPGNPDE